LALTEKQLTAPVARVLKNRGYELVIPAVETGRLSGKGEFGINVVSDGVEPTRKVDVVAARWDNERDIRSIAVECKAQLWAVYAGLGQAVQYQSVFDEVYVATPRTFEQDGTARSALVDLGLGHVVVEEETLRAQFSVPPAIRKPSRFVPHRNEIQVTPRLVLGLAFLEVSGTRPVRYGFWRGSQGSLGIWFGEDHLGHLQWNCWHNLLRRGERDEMGAGMTVQSKQEVKRICDSAPISSLQKAFSELPGYDIRIWYDSSVPGQGVKEFRTLPSVETDAKGFIDDLRACPSGYLPRFSLETYFDVEEWSGLSREESVHRLGMVREQVGPAMNLFAEYRG
jgi:hypothetical protein